MTTVATSVSVVGSSDKETIEIDQRPTTPSPSVFSVVSPQQLMPYPVTHKITRVTRKRGRTAIIISSPYKNELEETISKRKLAEDHKKRKREIKEQNKNIKTNLTKKKQEENQKLSYFTARK